MKLFIDSDALGKDAYLRNYLKEQKMLALEFPNIPAILYNMFADVAVFIFFIF